MDDFASSTAAAALGAFQDGFIDVMTWSFTNLWPVIFGIAILFLVWRLVRRFFSV